MQVYRVPPLLSAAPSTCCFPLGRFFRERPSEIFRELTSRFGLSVGCANSPKLLALRISPEELPARVNGGASGFD